MADYGIKVSRPGYDVKTAAPNQLVFSSKYSTLRVKQQGSGTITDSGGRTVTIAHNLGYVPMFLVHAQPDGRFGGIFYDKNDYFIHPVVPIAIDDCWTDRDVYAYADSTNLYIKVNNDFGWEYFATLNNSENYCQEDSISCDKYYAEVGYDPSYGVSKGALRFLNVNLNQGQTPYKSEIGFYITARGAGNVPTRLYGIDEDNTGGFPCAFSRPKTTAYTTPICDAGLGTGDTWAVEVTNQVNEIVTRAGWVNGNAMGFIYEDNGSSSGTYIYTDYVGDDCYFCSCSYLRVLKSNTLLNYKYTIFYNRIA